MGLFKSKDEQHRPRTWFDPVNGRKTCPLCDGKGKDKYGVTCPRCYGLGTIPK